MKEDSDMTEAIKPGVYCLIQFLESLSDSGKQEIWEWLDEDPEAIDKLIQAISGRRGVGKARDRANEK